MHTHAGAAEPLQPPVVAGLLRASLTAIRVEVEALRQEQLTWRPHPDAWCINEVLGHLIEAERRGFAGRIGRVLESDEPRFETWDQPAVARARGDDRRAGRELLGELEATRSASLQLLERLQPGALGRAGQHPVVGRLTIMDLLHEWVFHDRVHVEQIYAIVRAMVWSHMGNARRFSAAD